MKKFSIIVLLLIVSLSFFGCDTREFSGSLGDKPPQEIDVLDENGATLLVGNNFQYGDGYQGKIEGALDKINKGDTFKVNISFTVSRDLEESLEFGFVDTTKDALGVVDSYWGPLTWNADNDGKPYLFTGGALKAGVTHSASIDLKALADATGPSGAANAIVFQSKGKGKDGEKTGVAGSEGVEGPFIITFTEFTIFRY